MNYRKVLLLILISPLISFGQTGWFYQSPSIPIPRVQFNDVYFVNENTGWMAGARIIKTTDGGANWSTQRAIYYTDTIYNSIAMANSLTGYTCGQKGLLSRTTNGGDLWITLNIASVFDNFKDIYFQNVLTGYMVSDSARIFKTTDGGISWSNKRIEFNNYTAIKFINSTTGFVLTKSSLHILKTTNAGESWDFISTPFTGCRDIVFFNELTGYALSTRLWKTTDGGNQWTMFPLITIYTANKLFFKNELTGFVVGNNSEINFTTNGGNQWLSGSIIGENENITGIDFPNQQTGYLSGQTGKIFKTTDGGALWNSLRNSATEKNLSKAKFVNAQTGWACGQAGTLLKTINGGNNWDIQVTGTPNDLNCVYFVNSSTGWICGKNSTLKKSTESGINWINQTIDALGADLTKVTFLNENTGWICDNSSRLFKTTNSGTNWNIIFSTADFVINDFQFINVNTGFIIGGGYKYKTTNGGATWTMLGYDSHSNNSLSFLNELTGYIGSGNGLKKTTDGGANWTTLNYPISFFMIKFVNAQTGWADYIYKTTNAGINWVRQITPFSNLNCFEFINETTGWAVGEQGTIMKTTDGGNVFVQQVSSNIPEEFSLLRCYPNPFNPSTTISFQIPKKEFVNLVVYDLNGRVVFNLVNEKLNAGEYKINFDGSMQTSGIYFYKLTAGEFSETRKMVLVK